MSEAITQVLSLYNKNFALKNRDRIQFGYIT